MALGRQGDDLIGACPFCEATDALSISPAPNLWRCRACGVGGSVIDWVMRAEGVAFRHAVELLRDGFTPTRLDGSRPPARSSVAKLAAPFAPELPDADLLERVVGFYHQALLEAPDARAYLVERRIADGEAVERFGLGFSNRTLGYRLPATNRAEGKVMRSRLIDLGVYRPSGHEHYSGSLVVPVRDEHGIVVQLYGRKVRSDLRKGTPLHLWLPGDHRPVWNAEAIAASDEVIVCEGIVDALTLWCAGFRNVIAPGHPAGFGAELPAVLAEHRVRRILIGFDADGDGDTAADALAAELLAAGVECYRLHLAHGTDINGLARHSKSATDALGRVIRAAVWMGTGTPPHRRSSSDNPAAPTEVEAVSVVPPGPDPDVVPHVDGDELIVVLGDRRWRVRGLRRNTSFDALRVNVLVSIVGAERFNVDTLDLYAARARAAFIKATGDELSLQDDVVKRDLGRVLFAVEREVETLTGHLSPDR